MANFQFSLPLALLSCASIAALASATTSCAASPFKLPSLPYAYDGLQPAISSLIMTYHHDTHFAGYTRNLNAAVAKLPDPCQITDDASLKSALANLSSLPLELQVAFKNNGGGYLNHKHFFRVMSPTPKSMSESSPLYAVIVRRFGSFSNFKTVFLARAAGLFGSGFAWIAVNPKGALRIVTTRNQNNPAMRNLIPILPCDCWEHAWYSQYGPKKKDYFNQWWDTIDWATVESDYTTALASFRA